MIKRAKIERLRILSARENADFARLHPGEPWPPIHLMADAHAHTSYRRYWDSGVVQARFYADMFARHMDFDSGEPVRIFEWGCGTGRLVRQLRSTYPPAKAVISGSDYNPESVEWCARAFPGMTFFRNELAPPLALESDSIDIAYCQSVFTHLTDELCRQWIAELKRIVRPGGLISLTIAGWRFAHRYQEHERDAYRRGIPVYHEWDEAGRRDYFSWHPPRYVREVFLAGLEELEQHSGAETGSNTDIWLARLPLPRES